MRLSILILLTIDLKSGCYQVNAHAPYEGKTAFVCPFGTYRFLRMPFGLINAPARFQKLIDRFRIGLPIILMHIVYRFSIVLSENYFCGFTILLSQI